MRNNTNTKLHQQHIIPDDDAAMLMLNGYIEATLAQARKIWNL